ncbi:MAG: DUF4256 domain-containing protein [Flavobacteriaceae bacterium]
MTITSQQQKTLIETLKNRFDKHMNRHADIDWMQVQHKLEANPKKMWSLNEMEQTGGEPDVVGFDEQTGEFIFYDCSAESPSGRRSTCYDKEGLESRKQHKPDHNAIDLATEMKIELLTVEQYHKLQTFGKFDTKTSSWLQTPKEVRQLGGALFGDYRYGKVFIYHNGAQSYYAARGFRGVLKV